MKSWQIGDRAVILHSRFPERIGETVIIMSGLLAQSPQTGQTYSSLHHLVDLPSIKHPNLFAAYKPRDLGPIPDDYDGLKIVTWDTCPPEFHPDNFKVTV